MSKKPNYIISVADCETDPFKYGRIPEPFAIEFLNENQCETFWGDDCAEQFISFLELEEREGRIHLIYFHNGGKFDFYMLHKYLENPLRVINSRIVQANIGQHMIRDSLAIIPVPLKRFFKGAKGDIDYRYMERHWREKKKTQILEYLHLDCDSLYRVVKPFVDRFGKKLTVGSTAMAELIKRHDFDRMNPQQDAALRPFYYGGRVECFEHGVLLSGEKPFKSIDVNSEYPYAMLEFWHPKTAAFHQLEYMPDDFEMPFFLEFTGANRGALPMITDTGSLDFNVPYGRFRACSHEIKAALEFDLIKIDQVHVCYLAQDRIRFDTFVNDFYNEKRNAKLARDAVTEMFSKFMLNSAYGKFGQSPDNFKDWYLNRDFGNDAQLLANGYTLEADFDEFELWSRPASINKSAYFNVGIAASITSAARSVLLRGLQMAERPIYCDTDSILCADYKGALSDTELGAFKLEYEPLAAAIAGKKLYALYNPEILGKPKTVWNAEFQEYDPNPERRPLKISSKGGNLTLDQIIAICQGATVRYENDAPTFSPKRDTRFIHRNFRMTVDDAELPE